MILDFTIANYKSFRDMHTFSMVAAPLRANDAGLEEQHVFISEGIRALKTKAVFGQNASGKSNLIKGINAFLLLIDRSVADEKATAEVWEQRFGLLSDWDDQPMSFQMQFLHNGIVHRYGFQVLEGAIHSEWLHARPNKQEVKYFTRQPGGMYVNDVHLKEARSFIDLSMDGEHEIFRPNSLFLTGAALMGNKQCIDIRKKLLQIIINDDNEDLKSAQLSMSMIDREDSPGRNFILQFMKAIDPSVKDMQIIDTPEEIIMKFPDELKALMKSNDGKFPRSLFSFREQYDAAGNFAKRVPTSFADWESLGTKKLFALSGLLFLSLTSGRPLIIDEIDARFHPSITRKLVQLFHSEKTNPLNAQLVFVTHDASLLSHTNLRRDQITLIDKNKFGISNIRTLIEYKGVRKDASHEKEYLQGKYGAVPYLEGIDQFIASFFEHDVSGTE